MSDSHPPPLPAPSAPPPTAPPEEGRRRGGWLTDFAGLPQVGWGGWGVLAGIGVAIVLTFIGQITVAVFDPELDSTAGRDLAQLAVGLGLAASALIFAFRDAAGHLRTAIGRLGLDRFPRNTIGLALLGFLIYLAIAALIMPLLQPEQEDITNNLGADEDSAIALIAAGILIVIVAPLGEELFFRGFMYGGLRQTMPIWAAALLSAGVWGSLHLGGGNLGVVVQITLLGLVLSWLYERSGTLWAPILAHVLNNSLAFTLLVTGVDFGG